MSDIITPSINPDIDTNVNGKLHSNILNVTCHSAFGPNTNVYIDNHIMTMSQMHLAYSDKVSTTIGIDMSTLYMKKCGIVSVPEKIYIPSTTILSLEDGYNIECAPDSLILTCKGYCAISALQFDDTISVTRRNTETNKSFVEEVGIKGVHKSSGINMPVYLVLSEFENIFIPYGLKDMPNILSLVNFKQ